MLSTNPVMLTFGAGCADTGPTIASNAMAAKRKMPTLLIYRLLMWVWNCLDPDRHDIQTNTNTCREQCDGHVFTPKAPFAASQKPDLAGPEGGDGRGEFRAYRGGTGRSR